MTVKTCAFCGKLFHSLGQNACPECADKLDGEFVRVREYLYDHPESTGIAEIVENTGVSEKIVLYLLREGRLSRRIDAPQGTLKCAACGASIPSGRLCPKCLSMWHKDAEEHARKNAGQARTGGNEGPLKKGNKMHIEHS